MDPPLVVVKWRVTYLSAVWSPGALSCPNIRILQAGADLWSAGTLQKCHATMRKSCIYTRLIGNKTLWRTRRWFVVTPQKYRNTLALAEYWGPSHKERTSERISPARVSELPNAYIFLHASHPTSCHVDDSSWGPGPHVLLLTVIQFPVVPQLWDPFEGGLAGHQHASQSLTEGSLELQFPTFFPKDSFLTIKKVFIFKHRWSTPNPCLVPYLLLHESPNDILAEEFT